MLSTKVRLAWSWNTDHFLTVLYVCLENVLPRLPRGLEPLHRTSSTPPIPAEAAPSASPMAKVFLVQDFDSDSSGPSYAPSEQESESDQDETPKSAASVTLNQEVRFSNAFNAVYLLTN